MKFGSLFSGIGGFDLGLEMAGMECVWQVEIDDYCRQVLEKHWPDVKRYADIRDIATIEPVNLICGGFPCQDISHAGKRAGIDGERSGLWSEMARVIRLVRPRYVVVENVAALLHRGMERVLGDLAASGYDAEWDVIPASAVGAPHRRERVWIIAYPNSEWRETLIHADTGHGRALAAQTREPVGSRSDVAHAASVGREGSGAAWGRRTGSEDRRDDVADADLSRLEGWNGRILSERPGEFTAGAGRSLSDSDSQRFAEWSQCHGESQAGVFASFRNNAVGCGLSDWWATEPEVGRVAHGIPNRVDRLKGLGNAVVPQVARWIGERIIDWEVSHAL